MSKKNNYIKARITKLSKSRCEYFLNIIGLNMSSFLRLALEELIKKQVKIYFAKENEIKQEMKEVVIRVDEHFKKQSQKSLCNSNISAATFFQLVINALIKSCLKVTDIESNQYNVQINISDFGLISLNLIKVSEKEVVNMSILKIKNNTIKKQLNKFKSLVDITIATNKRNSDWPLRISFANQKGGVGKTTYNVQLALLLGLLGYKILFVDNDPQGNSSSFLLHDRLCNENELQRMGLRSAEIFDVTNFTNNDITKTTYQNIDIIYSNKNDSELTDREAMNIELITKQYQVISKIKDDYDFIIIDCVPSLGRLLLSSLSLSQHIISPLVLSGFAFDGVEGLLNTIVALKSEINPQLNYVGGFINNLNTDSKIQIKIKDQVIKDYPELVLKTIVPNRSPLDTATANRQSILFERYAYVTIINILDLFFEVFNKIETSYE